jgi:hypothetical protein
LIACCNSSEFAGNSSSCVRHRGIARASSVTIVVVVVVVVVVPRVPRVVRLVPARVRLRPSIRRRRFLVVSSPPRAVADVLARARRTSSLILAPPRRRAPVVVCGGVPRARDVAAPKSSPRRPPPTSSLFTHTPVPLSHEPSTKKTVAPPSIASIDRARATRAASIGRARPTSRRGSTTNDRRDPANRAPSTAPRDRWIDSRSSPRRRG